MDAVLAAADESALAVCLAVVCGDVCLAPGWHFDFCCTQIVEESAANGFGTWVPVGSEAVRIFQTDVGTLIWLQSVDLVYYIKAQYRVQAPQGVALAGHFVVDGGCVPRLLVYDIICAPELPVSPEHRYAMLQSCVWFHNTDLVLQWCGDCVALLSALEQRSLKLPHEVKAVAILKDDPLCQGLAQIRFASLPCG